MIRKPFFSPRLPRLSYTVLPKDAGLPLQVPPIPGAASPSPWPKEGLDDALARPALDFALRHLEKLPGGLSFSPFASLENAIHTIVMVGMDQDLLSTSVQQAIRESKDGMAHGARILKQITRVEKLILVVPDHLRETAAGCGCEVRTTSLAYPGFLPKLLMHRVFNHTVPAGLEPQDLGFLFVSAESVAALGRAFAQGKRDDDKIITVIAKNGAAQNVRVAVGTPIGHILRFCGIQAKDRDRVILGGPMRGKAVFSTDLPVEPDTDALMVQDAEDIVAPSLSPCINCGACVRLCPAKIQINMLVRFLENGLYQEAADRYDLFSCVECGLCSWACVSRIPIFQHIMLAKHEIARLKAKGHNL